MRDRLDDKRRKTPLPPISQSLESEFESLLARIDDVRRQFGGQVDEQAPTALPLLRNDEKIVIREAQRR